MTSSSGAAQNRRFVLSEEERMVQEAAHAFVADRMPIAQLRALRDSANPDGFDRTTWREMVALGWPGIAIAERHGGSGLGVHALAAVTEEIGRALGASPLASTALVAATVIARFAPADVASRWLPALADGSMIAALAVEEAAHPTASTTTALRRAGTTLTITGTKRYVADGAAADLLLVSATGDGNEVLALVRTNSRGVTVERRDTIDGRGLADIRLDEAVVEGVLSPANDCPAHRAFVTSFNRLLDEPDAQAFGERMDI